MRAQSVAQDLLGTFSHAARSEDPSEALNALVRDCVAQTAASRGDLYLLSLATTQFTLAFSTDPDSAEKTIPLNPSLLAKGDWRFRNVFENKKPTCGASKRSADTTHHLLIPIVRENACLGIIRLVPGGRALVDADTAAAQFVAQLAAFLIEKKYTLQLLTVIEKHFNYEQPLDTFLDEVMLLSAEACGFPYIVLREFDEAHGVLECIRSYGFSNLTPADLHLMPLSNYPLFAAAVASRTTQVLASNVAESSSVIVDVVEREELQRVVIVPIVVGGTVFGTASFSIACDHNITNLEQRGLEAVANFIGGAIANYRNVALAHEVFFERAKAAAAFTTVDVAQAARHEARNFVHNAQTNMATLLKMAGKGPGRARPEVSALVEDVFDDLNRIDIALDKIKAITKPIDQVEEVYDIDKLWNEALELVGGRLRAMNVRYSVRGKVSARCIPDLLRHAFLQLVLNSIDSFKESGSRRGHTIIVSIDECDDDVVIKYSDNGMGLDVTKLMGKDFHDSRRVSDIFLPGVTTKEGGSGYGLYLVRRALDAHRGSIDLVEYRNCMSFRLSFAKPAE